MPNRLSIAAFLASMCALAACQKPTSIVDDTCEVGIPADAFDLLVRDAAGTPQALGAVASFSHDSSVIPYNPSDSLNIVGGYAGFTYQVRISKQYYADTVVSGLSVAGIGVCDRPSTQVKVPIVLSLVPGAPPVRSVFVRPSWVELDRPNAETANFSTVMDANPGLSHAVRWSIIGDTGSVFLDAATGTLTYRCLPKSGYLTLTATSVADSTVVGRASIEVQGHPAATGDPPCS